MKLVFPICLALVTGSLGAGCGGESDWGNDGASPNAAPEASPASEPGRPLTVVRFRVGTSTVEFQAHGDGPEASIMMSVGGTGESGDPISRLMQEHGGQLTSLELFLGLAPDAEPPPALVAAHPREAKAIGRNDDSVVHVGPLAGVIIEI
jgi:hypothetical protein